MPFLSRRPPRRAARAGALAPALAQSFRLADNAAARQGTRDPRLRPLRSRLPANAAGAQILAIPPRLTQRRAVPVRLRPNWRDPPPLPRPLLTPPSVPEACKQCVAPATASPPRPDPGQAQEVTRDLAPAWSPFQDQRSWLVLQRRTLALVGTGQGHAPTAFAWAVALVWGLWAWGGWCVLLNSSGWR